MRGSGVTGIWRGSVGVYLAMLAVVGTLAVAGATATLEMVVGGVETLVKQTQGIEQQLAAKPATTPSSSAPARSTMTTTTGHLVLTEDGWNERLRTKEFWSGKGGSGSGPAKPYISRAATPPPQMPRPSEGEREQSAKYHDGEEETYRTVCVRLCDGYFWPISFSTTEEHFDRDQAKCEKSCGSPAKLYVYKNPGGEPETMANRDGQPYSRLKTAFLFRTKYDAQCKCTAQPWEQEALDRHRLYALEAARKKGDKVAGRQADELKSKVEAERRGQKAALATASVVAVGEAIMVEEERTLSLAGSPRSKSKSAKTERPQKSAANNGRSSGNSRPAGIMRAGAATTSGRGSGSQGAGSQATGQFRAAATSGRSGGWKSEAFRGN